MIHSWSKVFEILVDLEDGNDDKEFHEKDLLKKVGILKVKFKIIDVVKLAVFPEVLEEVKNFSENLFFIRFVSFLSNDQRLIDLKNDILGFAKLASDKVFNFVWKFIIKGE